MLLLEELELSVPYAVFAAARAACRDRPPRQPLSKGLDRSHLLGVGSVHWNAVVEVPISDVPHQRSNQARRLEIRVRFGYHVREAADRHTRVRRHAHAARAQRDSRIVCHVSRPPQLCALFGGGCPLEALPTVVSSDFTRGGCLLLDGRRGAMELEEEGRGDVEGERRVLVHRVDGGGVKQLDSRDWNPALDDRHRCLRRAFERVELTHR
mmetsp:Transcript_66575/g.157850  ORF Transcript_66575/g.157850 Transcript_66575/m.157850 type:complete len:210 (+) Transcript_66575:147-776(+)